MYKRQVGGGPAGIQAALTADQRGHEVILIEKQPKLGGALKWASAGPFKEDLRRYWDYLLHQVRNSTIDVRLNETCLLYTSFLMIVDLLTIILIDVAAGRHRRAHDLDRIGMGGKLTA